MELSKYFDAIPELVVNEDVFEAVHSEISRFGEGRIPQPIMIIGNEGAGKTTLLRRLYESCPDKHRVWIDGRRIFSTDDIVTSVSAPSNTVLFIDDIDFYLTRCNYDEQYKLRRFLYDESAPMLVSTASKVLPAISEYKAPFFEGLKTIYINSLADNELSKILNGSTLNRIIGLLNYLPRTINSVITAYYIVKSNALQSKDLNRLVALFSGRYNNIYRSLPDYSQNIVNSLAIEATGMKIPEIRELTGLPTNILTAYLKALKRSGIINIDDSIKKKTVYYIKDPLFRLWLQNSAE